MKMVCANSLNAKKYQAKKVQRHKPGSGTDVIMSLDEFSKPDRKLNHNPYGKREYMKVIRRKKLKKIFFFKKKKIKMKTQPKTLHRTQCLHRDLHGPQTCIKQTGGRKGPHTSL